jgi:integrase
MLSVELTARDVTLLPPRKRPYRVARGLYLHKTAPGYGSWLQFYFSPLLGRRVEMGFGGFPDISVPMAKAMALENRVAVAKKRCPLTERREAAAVRQAGWQATPKLTFRNVADYYLKAHETTWKNAKHAAQWPATLARYVYPVIGDLAVSAVDTGHIMQILEPIWHTKPETASRVRGRVETVLDYARARHWRIGENPARWKGHIDALLPAPTKVRPPGHHAALPWQELPALWQRLADKPEISAIALRFTLLTCVRTSEALKMLPAELDLLAATWTIPGPRTKSGRPFRVPLVKAALAELAAAEAIRTGLYVFSGARSGRPLSNMAMLELLRGMTQGATVHGTVRSGFRDWASEHAVPREVAEAALSHVVKDRTEAAYLRGDMLEPRRAVAQRWAQFLTTPPAAGKVVIPMRGRHQAEV